MTTQYHPRQDYVIVLPDKMPDTSPGGIVIPEGAQKELEEGKIIECGPDCSPDLKPGLYIVWIPNSAYRIAIDKVEVVWVKETAIMLTKEVEQPKKKFFSTEPTTDVGAKLFPNAN